MAASPTLHSMDSDGSESTKSSWNGYTVSHREYSMLNPTINPRKHLFPLCVVWTPIPCLTWLFPVIGHMGIAMSNGVIRDFAGPYFVSENDMGFGWPTRYWQLSLDQVSGGSPVWDKAVTEASDEYKLRNHNLFCDNCHSHVAMALNLMNYGGSRSWNMFWLALYILVKGKFVGKRGFFLQWLPFLAVVAILVVLCFVPSFLPGPRS